MQCECGGTFKKTAKYPLQGVRGLQIRGIRHCYKCRICGKRQKTIELTDEKLAEMFELTTEQRVARRERLKALQGQVEALQHGESRRTQRQVRYLLKQALGVMGNE